MKTTMKKIIATIMVLIILAQITTNSFASLEIGTKINLKCKSRLDSLLQYYKEEISDWSYKVAYYIYYIDEETGKKQPAICVELSKDGVGELGSYDTTIDVCKDDGIYTILYIYNNKKYSSWGLESEDDYYLAVQTAMHCYSEKIKPKDRYRVGDRVLEGYTPNTIDEIQKRGTAVLNTAQSLYNSAIKKEYKQQNLEVNLEEKGEWIEENINGTEYYSKKYKVTSNIDLEYYKVDTSSFYNNIKVFDLKNNEIDTNKNITNTELKIALQKSEISNEKTITGNIKISSATAKLSVAVYANSNNSNKQNYVVYTDKSEQTSITKEVSLTTTNNKTIINKIDIETNSPLEGAIFDIYMNEKDSNGDYIINEETYVLTTNKTDLDGKIIVELERAGDYILKEKEAPEGYAVSEEILEFTVQTGLAPEDKEIYVYNKELKLDLNIEKSGTKEAQTGEIIEYEFNNLKNNSNVSVNNFVWKDVLPTNAVRLIELSTGTWSEEVEYSIWYKTNLNEEYIMYRDKLNSTQNYTFKVSDMNLAKNEYITEYELRFGTVNSGFKENVNPKIYCEVLKGLENGYKFINNTYLTATYFDEKIEEKDEWETIIYTKEVPKEKKLPKTGA